MAYDEKLAERIRAVLRGRKEITEKAMFGGIAFMRAGKMFVGIAKNDLMVRVGPARHDEALDKPHARPMDFTGRPMRGYVFVAPQGFRTDAALRGWIDWAADFVATLDPKIKRGRVGRSAASPRGAHRGRSGTL